MEAPHRHIGCMYVLDSPRAEPRPITNGRKEKAQTKGFFLMDIAINARPAATLVLTLPIARPWVVYTVYMDLGGTCDNSFRDVCNKRQ